METTALKNILSSFPISKDIFIFNLPSLSMASMILWYKEATFGSHISVAQGLLLGLCSEISPSRAGGNICGARDWTQVICIKAGALPAIYYLSGPNEILDFQTTSSTVTVDC